MKTGLVKKAKIMNVISAVLMVLSGLLLILLSNMERLPIQRQSCWDISLTICTAWHFNLILPWGSSAACWRCW